MWTSEVNVPSFEWCSGDDWLQSPLFSQFASVIPTALRALTTESSDILLPMVPIKTSTHLIQRFLFGKVSTDHAFMAQSESFRHVSSREQQLEVVALSFGRIMMPSINKAVMDLEPFPVTNELFCELRLRLNFSLLRRLFLSES